METKNPIELDPMTGRCKICGQDEKVDHGPCIDIAMQRLADQHNNEHDTRILIVDEMLDHMPAADRVTWHNNRYGQAVISALVMALIKLGVINCEEIIYDNLVKGREAETVQEAKEDPGS